MAKYVLLDLFSNRFRKFTKKCWCYLHGNENTENLCACANTEMANDVLLVPFSNRFKSLPINNSVIYGSMTKLNFYAHVHTLEKAKHVLFDLFSNRF